jgi:glutamate racemase
VDRPIGMFDSGFGGLTVARAVIDLLPQEDLVYIGDTGRYPYGSKPLDEVREYARELAWSLVEDHDAKAVVVACNTAAAALLDELAAELSVPVIDVVEPGARAWYGSPPHRPRRRDRHRRHDGIRRLCACRRRDRRAGGTHGARPVRASSSSSSAARPTGDEVTLLAERLLAPVRDAASTRCCSAAPTTRSSRARSAR